MHTENQEFLPPSDRLQKGMSQNLCDGRLVIVECFYLRKVEFDQQSLNCIARNKCLYKMCDRDTLIEQLP